MDFQKIATFGKQYTRFGFRLVKRLAKLSICFAAIHIFSNAVVESEYQAARYAVETANAMMEQVAPAFGFQRPEPKDDPLSYLEMVSLEAFRNGINPALGRALFLEESGGDCAVVSWAGAIGCMQLMPRTAKDVCGLSKDELKDPAKNIPCGFKYFRQRLDAQSWNPVRALQAYNGGDGCVGRCSESIKHAEKVLKRFSSDTSL